MLWIALFLPELPLQSVESRLWQGPDPTSAQPHAISEGPDTRPVLCAVNASARELGIRPQQTVSTARALVSDLLVTPRQHAWEEETLKKVATIASQFTPMVCMDSESVLLEISSSLKLFGGLGQLFSRLRSSLQESGLHALAGIAPTPLAACLFAKARITRPGVRGSLQSEDLPMRLADLPLALFGWPHAKLATLAQLGLTRIRDLADLPRAGLTRRFGKEIIHDLDRALGRIPDPRPAFVLPEHFSTRVEFMREVIHFEGLRFPIRRMLSELEQFLRARGAAISGWTLTFEHTRTLQSTIRITTQRPTRERERWENLLCERIARTPLSGEVSAMTLDCDAVQPLEEENLSWLPDAQKQAGKLGDLLERLSARLGDGCIYGIATREDHRPEHAWSRLATDSVHRSSTSSHPALPWPSRPLWLLPIPRALITRDQHPQNQGELSLLSGPERIECGWWDGQAALRDYFVAQNPVGEKVWIYRELKTPDTWFLHGLFS